jgi:hypothetical protein
MDQGAAMTPFDDLLTNWPGRFRRAALLTVLSRLEPPDVASITDAALDDVIADRDEEAAAQHLLDVGEFAAVRTVLDADLSLTARRRTALRDQLDQRISGRVRQVVEDIAGLEEVAKHAGIRLGVDREMLEDICRESWPEAEHQIRVADHDLQKQLSEERSLLASQLPALSPAVRRSVDIMLRDGYLREVRYLDEHGMLDDPGPFAVPPPPSWDWEAGPTEVLDWFLDPNRLRPPQFGAWLEAAADPEAEQFLACLRNLATDTREAVIAFAGAFEAFLSPGAETPKPPDAVPAPDGGYLVQIGNVFTEPEIAPFRLTRTVRVSSPPLMSSPFPTTSRNSAITPSRSASHSNARRPRTGAPALYSTSGVCCAWRRVRKAAPSDWHACWAASGRSKRSAARTPVCAACSTPPGPAGPRSAGWSTWPAWAV